MQVFDIATGQELALLSQGHYDTVTACVFSPLTGHLWSTGLDGMILAWCPDTQPDIDAQPTTSHYLDTWLPAAAAGRGRQRQDQEGTGGGTAAAAGLRARGRAALPDVDFWSDDEVSAFLR